VLSWTLVEVSGRERFDAMEAVIATGGKQYCVTTGQVISI
jgi:hypothetical protein